MKLRFWKMHGAGNDFILADDRAGKFPVADKGWITRISTRRTGIGCEGVILIQKSKKADFRMRFFNPDGGEADMCGNGARCIARLAYEIGAAPAEMSIETGAGMLKAEVSGDTVRIHMTKPKDWRIDKTLMIKKKCVKYSFVNSGVPHVVVEVPDLQSVDVESMGAAIRYHADLAPAGTNANFISVTGPQSLSIRTYERGVEAETLACGTGMVASALISGKLGLVKAPVAVTCASGDVLEIGYELTESGARNVTLRGSAVHVFNGTVEYC
ncbi:MAG: diaminopimelate epimerase [bacterium]